MNLLEKALLIKDIHQTIAMIDNEHLPLFKRAQATHHLKEIFQLCEKPITFRTPKGTHIPSEAHVHLSNELLKLSKFKNSYRGLFYDRSLLLQALNQNPNMGWAILYDQEQRLWQVWLIPQARRGAIHCSWKGHLNEGYQWMLQQQNLLQCLLTDDEFNERLGIHPLFGQNSKRPSSCRTLKYPMTFLSSLLQKKSIIQSIFTKLPRFELKVSASYVLKSFSKS
jgi:hypothetical protein